MFTAVFRALFWVFLVENMSILPKCRVNRLPGQWVIFDLSPPSFRCIHNSAGKDTNRRFWPVSFCCPKSRCGGVFFQKNTPPQQEFCISRLTGQRRYLDVFPPGFRFLPLIVGKVNKFNYRTGSMRYPRIVQKATGIPDMVKKPPHFIVQVSTWHTNIPKSWIRASYLGFQVEGFLPDWAFSKGADLCVFLPLPTRCFLENIQ